MSTGGVYNVALRRGGRAVDCTGLENRRPFTGLVSSNLTLSAITTKFCSLFAMGNKTTGLSGLSAGGGHWLRE